MQPFIIALKAELDAKEVSLTPILADEALKMGIHFILRLSTC